MSTAVGEQPAEEVAKVVEVPSIPVPNVTESSKPNVATPSAADEAKLSALEKKKLKQAEKAARRAKVVEQKVESGAPSSIPEGIPKKDKKETISANAEKASVKSKESKEATGSTKTRSTQDTKHKPTTTSGDSSLPIQKPALLFDHLPQGKDMGTLTVKDLKGVHQDVQILGLKTIDYRIVGSNARLVSMLTVLKNVIRDYKTPANQALTRHFVPHVLDRQISHLHECRPLSVSQGTAIRWLKLQISKIDVKTSEYEAKAQLCQLIDEFIRDKSTLAHQLIAEKGAEKINDGDVVLTYCRSAVVEKTIRKAWADGKRFSVIIIDNEEPLREGLKLAESLGGDKNLSAMEISLGDFGTISYYIDQATKVFLGASAMMSNGVLYSRMGTSGVALEANSTDIPIIVLCESVKFSSESPDGLADINEISPVDDIFGGNQAARNFGEGLSVKDGITKSEIEKMNESDEAKHFSWDQHVNMMYDTTPAEWINIVISEHGAVPPTSVPILNRLYNEANDA